MYIFSVFSNKFDCGWIVLWIKLIVVVPAVKFQRKNFVNNPPGTDDVDFRWF
jgi:hypothetical protein